MKNNILVTGSSGFIGSHVVETLKKQKKNVIGIDIKRSRFTDFQIDIKDIKALDNLFKQHKITKIIHLAAKAGVRQSIKNPQIYIDNNITGTQNMLEMAQKYKIEKFIFASSSSVYGDNDDLPWKESTRLKPISPYAASKIAGEIFCSVYNKLFDLNIIALRFFTVYGPNNREDMAIYKFIDAIHNKKVIEVYGEGNQLRDFTFINDIVDGILKALEKELISQFEIVNLGNADTISVNYLIDSIFRHMKKKTKVVYKKEQQGDVFITNADIFFAKIFLDWEPKTSIDEGLKKTIRWYNENIACKTNK